MDRHNLPGVTAKDVAEAHQQDLKIQHLFGCRALTYWFDEERQTAFCLIEAANEEAVKRMHDQAHGLVPHQIIEVKNELIEAFLGRIEDPQDAGADHSRPFINESAYRAVMAVAFNPLSFEDSDNKKTVAVQQEDIRQIRERWQQYDGREVESRDEVYLTSFASVSKALSCAIEIQKEYKKIAVNASCRGKGLSIGLSTGVPVTGSKELFGDTVQLAKRLCLASGKKQVLAAANVKGFYKKKSRHSSGSADEIKVLNVGEENFINRLMDVTETRWQEATLTTGDLAKAIGVSKAQLYRKTTALTGYSPLDFLKTFRLQKALTLLERHEGSVAGIAYESGFTSPSYFSKCFQKRFGILPSKYAAING